MFCENCGIQMDDNLKHCPKCGFKVWIFGEENNIEPKNDEENKSEPQNVKENKSESQNDEKASETEETTQEKKAEPLKPSDVLIAIVVGIIIIVVGCVAAVVGVKLIKFLFLLVKAIIESIF